VTTLVYLPSFEADALDIWSHVARDNPAAADRLIEALYARCLILEDHPEAGPRRVDIAAECRQLVEGPVLILYRLSGRRVELVRALYRGRELTPGLFDPTSDPEGH